MPFNQQFMVVLKVCKNLWVGNGKDLGDFVCREAHWPSDLGELLPSCTVVDGGTILDEEAIAREAICATSLPARVRGPVPPIRSWKSKVRDLSAELMLQKIDYFNTRNQFAGISKSKKIKAIKKKGINLVMNFQGKAGSNVTPSFKLAHTQLTIQRHKLRSIRRFFVPASRNHFLQLHWNRSNVKERAPLLPQCLANVGH